MSTLTESVQHLRVVLRAEEELYVRLRDVLRREESELIGLDPEAITQTVEEKRALVEEGRIFEESRLALMREIAAEVGLPEESLRLSSLIVALDDEAGDLAGIHARLSALIKGTRALLEGNERFATRSLHRVRDTLQLLGRSVPEEVGYGPAARSGRPSGRGRLVRQAI